MQAGVGSSRVSGGARRCHESRSSYWKRSLAARKHSVDCPRNSWSAAALNGPTSHSTLLVIARMSVDAPVDASWT